jgi:hypothetical protein
MAKEYNITRSAGRCTACQAELAPQQEFVATVREVPAADDPDGQEQLAREDYCLACWAPLREKAAADRSILGIWQSHVPEPKEKKKTFVDDEVLVNFFERLEDAEEPAKIQFRFVLALILMRKKMLVYDGLESGEGDMPWLMHFRGSGKKCRVVDPHMDEDKIAEVSRQLGEVLEGDL